MGRRLRSIERACLWGLFLVIWGALSISEAEELPYPPLAEKYCTACHLAPSPQVMPRSAWTQVFGYMSVWIQEKNLPFNPTEYTQLLNEYIAQSPQTLAQIPNNLPDGGLSFRKESLDLVLPGEYPVITDLHVTDLDGDGRPDILVCDDTAGRVSRLRIVEGHWQETTIFEVKGPSRAKVFDYDGDGRLDILVSCLGTISPTDQEVGAVWLLRQTENGDYDPQPLLLNCPRVSDVKFGDFNGDGKVDILVAQFGWRTTGGILWLEQRSPTEFVAHEIANVHGALQVEVLDYDGNGTLDFIALFAQEHESLVLFSNNGRGEFEHRIIARASHPAYGSSGFSVVDLDQDGDPDILWTNGDMMDEIPLAKPDHGLRWIENKGDHEVVHDLVRMPGCYRAVAYDLDGDGDLDIVVSSLYPQWDRHDFPSLIWLENDGAQNFTARRLLDSPSNLASLVVGDFDGDGLPDIVVGGMHSVGPLERVGRLTALMGVKLEGEGSAKAGDQKKSKRTPAIKENP